MVKNKALGLALFLLALLPADSFADFAFGSFNMRKWETGDLNYVTTYNDNLQILNDELLNITTGQFAVELASVSLSTASLQAEVDALNITTTTFAVKNNTVLTGSVTWQGVEYRAPPADGGASDLLSTDGAGQLSFIPSPNLAPTGSVVMFSTDTAPTGWYECDGSEKNRTTDAALFAVIGTTFGQGDGATTFNLPDLRGTFVRGWDNGAGNDPESGSRTESGTGGSTGDNVGSFQDHALESHTHTASQNQVSLSGSGFLATFLGGETSGPNGANVSNNETRPRNIYLMYIIKR